MAKYLKLTNTSLANKPLLNLDTVEGFTAVNLLSGSGDVDTILALVTGFDYIGSIGPMDFQNAGYIEISSNTADNILETLKEINESITGNPGSQVIELFTKHQITGFSFA